MRRPTLIAAALAGGLLLLSACGGGGDATTESPDAAGSPDATGAPEAGAVTVGGPNFTEGQLMTELYRLVLEDAGFTVEVVTVDSREIYAPELERGSIDVVPEYAATMAEYLNANVNGPDAPTTDPVATNDADETVAALNELGEPLGIQALDPSGAANQNGFAVSEEFSASAGVTSLSQLGELGRPVVLAAVEECPDRPFCQPGLEEVYGLEITEVLPLGFSSLQTKTAVQEGDADLGLVGTTDGTLPFFGLVLLDDDQNLQLADNLVPVVNIEASTPELEAALNELAAVLTTGDLATMNAAVDQERQKPADVAAAYLAEQGLVG
jgi:osmoprotectant transport system substrate-binding protein